MVVDSCVILSILFEEKHKTWSVNMLDQHINNLVMSTVNLTEVLIRVKEAQNEKTTNYQNIKAVLYSMPIKFIEPNQYQAEVASDARLSFPINLGDCFCYALARQTNDAIISLDHDFQKTDIEVLCP